jgi:hypothetical protein
MPADEEDGDPEVEKGIHFYGFAERVRSCS